jgi:mRNA-degrading endonuclease toxin of MazEF toxin-antitoxin module
VSSPTPPRLYQGRILEATVPDQQGRNHKKRPLVIVTPTDEILPGAPFRVVCISTQGERYPSSYLVPIPGGNPRIGVPWDSHAICDWVCSIRETDGAGLLGRLPNALLARVLSAYNRFCRSLTT